jgi:hypothetical protein
MANEAGGLEASGKRLLIEAMLAEFGQLNARLEAIANIDDGEMQRQKLAAVLTDLERYKKNLSHDPAMAQAIYKVLCAAFANGMAEAQPATTKETKA